MPEMWTMRMWRHEDILVLAPGHAGRCRAQCQSGRRGSASRSLRRPRAGSASSRWRIRSARAERPLWCLRASARSSATTAQRAAARASGSGSRTSTRGIDGLTVSAPAAAAASIKAATAACALGIPVVEGIDLAQTDETQPALARHLGRPVRGHTVEQRDGRGRCEARRPTQPSSAARSRNSAKPRPDAVFWFRAKSTVAILWLARRSGVALHDPLHLGCGHGSATF